MKNWKTTLTGALVVIAGVALIYVGKTVEGTALLVAGLGLLSAKDNNVTGGSVKQ